MELLKVDNDFLRSSCSQLKAENADLLEKNKLLQEKVKSVAFDQDTFRYDDKKVRYYTGLTNWTVSTASS